MSNRAGLGSVSTQFAPPSLRRAQQPLHDWNDPMHPAEFTTDATLRDTCLLQKSTLLTKLRRLNRKLWSSGARRHQTRDFGEHATSAPAELGGKIHNVSRNRARTQVLPSAGTEVARLHKWRVWCILGLVLRSAGAEGGLLHAVSPGVLELRACSAASRRYATPNLPAKNLSAEIAWL